MKKQNKKKNIENIQMDKLHLPEKIRDIFKKTLGFKEKDEENKEI